MRREAASPRPARSPLAGAKPLILARATAAAVAVMLPLVLVRRLDQEDYGTYKQLFMIAQTIYYVVPLGVPQSLYFFLPRAREGRPYLFQALIFLTGIGALASLALVAGANRIGAWMNSPDLARCAPALAVYLFGTVCSSPLEISLTARGRTRLSSLFYLGSELFRTAAMTLPALLGMGLSGVMDGIAVFGLLRVALTWAIVPWGAQGPWATRGALLEQLRYALPFGAAMALGVPQGYFHQYAVSAHVSAAVFAVYAVGLFQVPFVDLLHSPTTEVLMVALGELDREGRRSESADVYRSAASRLAYAFIPMVVFLEVAATQFISALFTDRYLAAVPIFRIAVASTLFAIFPLEGVLRARGETVYILKSNVAKVLVTVPLVLLGVRTLGMAGAIAAWLACELVGRGILLARLPRILGAKLVMLFPWKELARAAAASLLAAAAMSIAYAVYAGRTPAAAGGRPIAALALCTGSFGLGYIAALLLVGARTPFALLGLKRAPVDQALAR